MDKILDQKVMMKTVAGLNRDRFHVVTANPDRIRGGRSSTAGRKNNKSKQVDLRDDSEQKVIENIRSFFPE